MASRMMKKARPAARRAVAQVKETANTIGERAGTMLESVVNAGAAAAGAVVGAVQSVTGTGEQSSGGGQSSSSSSNS
jgi:hypothetical protein